MRTASRSLNTIAQRGAIGWTINRIARSASFEGIDARQNVRKYAAEQGMSFQYALARRDGAKGERLRRRRRQELPPA